MLLVVQIILCLILIGLVMLQGSGSGLGSAFSGGGTYRSRKGIERGVFLATIGVGILFAVSSILNILL